MSGETTVEPGYLYNEITGEVNNLNKLNRLGNPTVRVNSGAIGTDELADGSVTSDKLDEDIIAQINADATIGDGSITTSKLASGSVTYVKLNADVLAKMVERDTPTSTVGNFLRYVNTAGVTEEVTPAELTELVTPIKVWGVFNGTTGSKLYGSTSFNILSKGGTGDYTIGFTSPLSSANYAINVTAVGPDGSNHLIPYIFPSSKNASSCRVQIYGIDGSGNATSRLDADEVNFTVTLF